MVTLGLAQPGVGFAPTTTTGTFTLANTPATGNALIIIVAYNSSDGAPAAPSGFGTLFTTDDSGHNDGLAVYARFAPSGASKTYSITSKGDYIAGLGLYEIQGAASPTIWNGHTVTGGATGTSITTAALAPTLTGCLALAAYTQDNNNQGFTGASPGWTVINESGNYHGGCSAALNTLTTTSAPVSCEFEFSNSVGPNTEVIILISPATQSTTSYTFTATVKDTVTNQTGNATATFTVTGGTPPPPPLSITTTSAGGGQVNTVYSSVTFTATGGVTPYTWSVVNGSLPTGLTFSSAGVLSGTPTVAGSYTFTVQVADNATHTATQAYTVVISGAPVFTGSYPANGEHPTYTITGQTGNTFTFPGQTSNAYVDGNVWGPVSGETVTLEVWTVNNWQVSVNCTNSSGGVTCFPNTAPGNPLSPSVNWSALNYLISGWNEEMDTESNIIASACYDNWVNSTLVPTQLGFTNPVNEIMWHFDFRNRGAGPWYAQNVPFGGTTINGVAIPKTYWSLAYSGTALFWNQTDGNSNIYSTPVGAIDVKGMMTYLVNQGLISAGCDFTGFSLGFEICDTEGATRNFKYNSMYVQAG